MAVYEIVERRCYDQTTIIEADDRESAQGWHGIVLEEYSSESWGERLVSVMEVEIDE